MAFASCVINCRRASNRGCSCAREGERSQQAEQRKPTAPLPPHPDAGDKTSLQNEIWRKVVTSTGGEGNLGARLLLLPALNDMFDITTTREIAVQAHPPLTIFLMLFGMALGCAALTGYGMARIPQPSPVHMLGFAAATALTFYIILDIEYPRSGFIRLDAANQLLFEMRDKLAHSESAER